MTVEEVTGVITSVNSRETDYGNMWDIYVASNVPGNDNVKYGTGKQQCPHPVGSKVRFTVLRNGQYLNVKPGTLSLVEGGATTTPQAPTSAATTAAPVQAQSHPQRVPSVVNGDFKVSPYSDDRQCSIVFQSARNAAIETVKLLLSADAMGFKATTKPGERHDLITAKISDVTREYFHEAINWKATAGPPPVVGVKRVD